MLSVTHNLHLNIHEIWIDILASASELQVVSPQTICGCLQCGVSGWAPEPGSTSPGPVTTINI